MTVMLYDTVLGVVDSTPRTKEEITEIICKDFRYKSDKVAYSKKVYLALKQLKSEGKIRLEDRIRGDIIVPCYRVEDGSRHRNAPSRSEEVLNAMAKDEWVFANELTVDLYGHDRARYSTMYSRVTRALATLQNKGMVISRLSGRYNCYGTEMRQWKRIV